MVEPKAERVAVPKRPKKRKELFKYFERNKEDILVDYQFMKLIDFFHKWGFTSNTWTKLKKRWGIAGKRGPKPTSQEETGHKIDGKALSEHDRYLILLGYQQAVREIFGHTLSLERLPGDGTDRGGRMR